MPKRRPNPTVLVKIKYDPDRHCGGRILKSGRTRYCTALKGQGTDHPGAGKCSGCGGSKPSNYYLSLRPTRLHYLLQRVKDAGSNPCDILNELDTMRAMTIAFIEDNSELDDPEAILQASDLLSRITKAAQQYQQIQQAETMHIKSVELIHMQMAQVMYEFIMKADPALGEDWREKLVERIKNQWGMIKIETNPKEVKKMMEESANGTNTY